MANIHVLDRGVDGKFHVAYHFNTPAGNNSATVSWATALINSGIGGKTVLPDGDGTKGTISSTEKASIVSGTVLEVVVSVDVTDGGANTTVSQMTTYLNANYAVVQTAVQADLQRRLAWFGGTI